MQRVTGVGVARCSQDLTTTRWLIAAQQYQDKFLLVQFWQLLATLNDKPIEARADDSIHTPCGALHIYENCSSGTVKDIGYPKIGQLMSLGTQPSDPSLT